jgi:hypothetical protein
MMMMKTTNFFVFYRGWGIRDQKQQVGKEGKIRARGEKLDYL